MKSGRILKKDDRLVLATPKLKLNFYDNMYLVPEYLKDNKWITLCIDKNTSYAKPAHYAVIEGKEVSKFKIQKELAEETEIQDYLGSGVRFSIKGIDKESFEVPVSVELLIEVFDEFPSSAIIRSIFRVEGNKEYSFDRLYANNLVVDSRLLAGKKPYEFFGFFGSGEMREHLVQEITEDFRKDSYMGIYDTHDGGGARPDYRWGTQPGYGGGLPLSYIWQKNLGIGICNIETKYKICYLPVKVEKDGIVTMGLNYKTKEKISKKTQFISMKTAITLQEGDYYNGIESYSKMMKRQGLHFPEGTNESYEPSWCTWGFNSTYTKEEILALLPSLREIGIKWITLDDRWYGNIGDWDLRADMFPGGEEDFKQFIETLHKEGFKVQLWTMPGMIDGITDMKEFLKDYPNANVEASKHPYHTVSKLVEKNPDWFITSPNGKREITKRGYYFTCSCHNGAKKHFHELVTKFFADWKIDGLKQDSVYISPACYNEKHHHMYPEEAIERFDEIARTIYETATAINPDAVIESSPPGTPVTFSVLQWQNQGMVPDPWTSWICRSYSKFLKALIGPKAAIYADHVEILDNGDDFASQIGIGSVPGTRYNIEGIDKTAKKEVQGWMAFKEDPLTREKIDCWKKWITIYRDKMLSKGEYLNLYDLIYDKPEAHVVCKDGKMYYAFYATEPDGLVEPWGGIEEYIKFDGKFGSKQMALVKKHYEEMKAPLMRKFKGKVELRGLDKNKTYSVYDYANNVKFSDITGTHPFIDADFTNFLLLEVVEKGL
ncbi:MAG: hypothetical protein A2252_05910 [Elusimicrobia bacterium RIFOXYA2_FULL_39_19]|nr:MAG: hypothetical protein A2252_05910 [Elusimicrobia bacterium RIFOXYA2_FULL_39_19]